MDDSKCILHGLLGAFNFFACEHERWQVHFPEDQVKVFLANSILEEHFLHFREGSFDRVFCFLCRIFIHVVISGRIHAILFFLLFCIIFAHLWRSVPHRTLLLSLGCRDWLDHGGLGFRVFHFRLAIFFAFIWIGFHLGRLNFTSQMRLIFDLYGFGASKSLFTLVAANILRGIDALISLSRHLDDFVLDGAWVSGCINQVFSERRFFPTFLCLLILRRNLRIHLRSPSNLPMIIT